MSIIDKLETAHQFTLLEKEIVNYILDNKDQVVHLKISDLANATDTSNATIVRLCRKLGINGYREFKIEFIKDLERRRKEKREIDMSYPFSDKESSQEVMKKILELSKESLDSCYENISSRDIEEVAKWIRDANAVYLFGTGDTMISAIGFGNKLMKLGKNAVVSGMYGEETAHCYHVSQKDVALFVSYSGNAVINKKYLKMMKRAGCKLVLISSNENLDDFDKKLLIPKKEADEEKMATYYSQTCIHYILNSLYAMYFNLDFEKNYRIKTNIDYHI